MQVHQPIPPPKKGKKQKGLKELKFREDIFITNAEKGGAAVILDIKDYNKGSAKQLNDIEHHKHLEHDPTTENNTVNNFIARFKDKKLIDSNVSDGLKVESPRTSRFYIQQKIHKEGNPGILVISSLNCNTFKISEYVDFHLQPIDKQNPRM